MIYNIPHDDKKKFRRQTFLQLLSKNSMRYVDGATDYCLLLPFAKEHNLNTEQKLWLAYLYGLSYSCTTSIRFFMAFPNLSEIKTKKLRKFWEENKKSLYFNPDKKYIKNNDQVIPAIKSLYYRSRGGCLKEYMKPYLTKGFDAMYTEILKHWRFFGPHGAYLFFDALYGLCPKIYTDPTNLDWKNCGKTVSDGMAHLLYRDSCVGTNQHDYEKYNKIVDILVEKTEYPKVIIESTLCAFRKLFKGTRYCGYYADRMLEECKLTESYLESLGIDIWQYRAQTIPEKFRGEIQGWQGIRKEKCKQFLQEGKL